MRMVSTRVLPVPAPASTSTGPSSVSTASRCSALRPGEIGRAAARRGAGARRDAARHGGGRFGRLEGALYGFSHGARRH